jgi:uncharacterized Zn finger protein
MMLAPVLTPHGSLVLRQAEEAFAAQPDVKLEQAFSRGPGHGLLYLGADQVGTALPPVLSYWREFAVHYVTALCALPDVAEGGTKPPVPVPADGELDRMAAAVPPMTGAEYLTARGRTYVRNGSVVDLQIAKGEVVAGSLLYKIKITVAPVTAARWKAICRDCAGEINSVVELLQGRLAKGVMDRVCQQGDGLFPSPKEIKLSCDCPDSAKMCKHVAAALYGVGARLDERPQLLFKLRGVDESELLAHAGQDLALTKAPRGAANILDNSDVAALFGLDMAEAAVPDAAVPAVAKQDVRSGPSRGSKTPVTKDSAPKKKSSRSGAAQTPSKSKKAGRAGAAKGKPRPIDAAQLKTRQKPTLGRDKNYRVISPA